MFILDRDDNPHPAMLDHAIVAWRAAQVAPRRRAGAYWRGYLDAMALATGLPAEEVAAWVVRHALSRDG